MDQRRKRKLTADINKLKRAELAYALNYIVNQQPEAKDFQPLKVQIKYNLLESSSVEELERYVASCLEGKSNRVELGQTGRGTSGSGGVSALARAADVTEDAAWTHEEKIALGELVMNLTGGDLRKLLRMVQVREPSVWMNQDVNAEEVEVDFERLKPSTLCEIKSFAQACVGNLRESQGNVAPSTSFGNFREGAAGSDASNHPMPYDDQLKLARNIRKLPEDKLREIVRIIHLHEPTKVDLSANEIDIAFETLQSFTFRDLERYVDFQLNTTPVEGSICPKPPKLVPAPELTGSTSARRGILLDNLSLPRDRNPKRKVRFERREGFAKTNRGPVDQTGKVCRRRTGVGGSLVQVKPATKKVSLSSPKLKDGVLK